MKKVIAIFFLFLANVLLLAHTAFFHHHHDSTHIVLASSTYHECDCNAHRNNDAQPVGHCNDPYCHGDIDDCILSTIYVKLDDDRLTIQLHIFNFVLLPCFFSLFPNYLIPYIADDVGLPFRQKPYLLSCHTEYISQSIRLRAPPVC